jgi:hypothetical protein
VADQAELPLGRGKKAERFAVDDRVAEMFHGAESGYMGCAMRSGLALGSTETYPGDEVGAVRTSPELGVDQRLLAAAVEREGSGAGLGTLDMGCGFGCSGGSGSSDPARCAGLPMGYRYGCWTPYLRSL